VYNTNEGDNVLIEQVKNGNTEAFCPLVERYKMALYKIIYRMVGNRDNTEDLVQEVFIKAFNEIKKFKSGMPFYPWISKVAVNHTINYLKRERQDRFMPIDDLKEVLPSHKDDPVKMTREKMLKEKIAMAMAKLPHDYRVIMVLRVEEDLPYDEISRILKIPRGTVMSRLARARQKLKEIFREIKVNDYAL